MQLHRTSQDMNIIIIFLLLFVKALCSSAEGAHNLIIDGEAIQNEDAHVKYIVPGYPSQKFQKLSTLQLSDFVSKDNEYYKILQRHIEAGHIMRGLTFTIYDDNMRDAAIALFRLLQRSSEANRNEIKKWAFNNINNDLTEYVFNLASLYQYRGCGQIPPFVRKPNYFLNMEVISKAKTLKIANGKFDQQEALSQNFYRTDDKITINTNYSSWHLLNDECRNFLDYFIEDVNLNSYYYGMHLLYPFWMNKDELTGMDSKYAEQYYFVHQQLMARYFLEEEHLKYLNIARNASCNNGYVPYLIHDNGLPFPARSSIREEWNDGLARIKSIDIAIKECISRGVIFMENGTKVKLTEENYVGLLAKLIRANFESNHTAKILRSVFGYSGNNYPANRYNPAPSVLHHPETTLRDPIYWYMIKVMLKYFAEYSSSLQPYDFSKYQTDEFHIIDNSFTKITTYYEFFEFSIDNIFRNNNNDNKISPLTFTVRQKRLKHLPFTLSFTVHSQVNKTVIIKLFLGPPCDESNCWNEHAKFFELDSFTQKFDIELNHVKWSPEQSTRYSFDDHFNLEYGKDLPENKYDLLKFPENLIIPKGLSQGLNLTLFILITPFDDTDDPSISIDSLEPLGYPFHREAFVDNTISFYNYKFYNITVYHKENPNENIGYFSSHLN